MNHTQASAGPARRALIVNADDFGLHLRVNDAVERAHRNGVLSSASLMVAGDAAADAVKRARRLPTLRVGLHVVLADGRAISPRNDIPLLVDDQGRFGNAMVRDGVRFFFLPRVRAQLAREIRAQFEAFTATGLPLDHVNTHKHFHLHPTVLSLLIEIGSEYGMRAIRLPCETPGSLALRPWIALVRARLDRRGIAHNDHIAGLAQSGQMDEAAFLKALATLPDGVNEIYCHPAVPGDSPLTPTMPDYRHADELEALLSPRVAAAMDTTGLPRGGFSDVFPAAAAVEPALRAP